MNFCPVLFSTVAELGEIFLSTKNFHLLVSIDTWILSIIHSTVSVFGFLKANKDKPRQGFTPDMSAL